MISKKQFEQLLDNQDRNVLRKTFEERYKKSIVYNKQQNTGNKIRFRKTIIAAAIILAIAFILIPLGVMMQQKITAPQAIPENSTKDENNTTDGRFPYVQSGSYKSVFVDDSRNPLGFSTGKIDFWGGTVNNPNARQHIQVSFEGTTYNCEYSGHSSPANEYDCEIDYYYVQETTGSNISMIMIERDTEKLRGIVFSARVDFSVVISNSVIEEYRPRAKEIASLYVNTEEYELTEEDYVYSKSELGLTKTPMLVYTFNKKIGSFKTGDKVVIRFMPGGDLSSIELSDIGRYNALDSGLQINKEELNDSIKDLIAAKYTDSNYVINDQWLSVSSDGKMLIISDVLLTKKNGVISRIIISTEV